MKRFSIVSIATLLFALLVPASFAATSLASLNGTYNFQVSDVKGVYGYYCGAGQNGNCPWHTLGNGAQCPAKVNCQTQYTQDVSVGTLNFNGKGTVKFLTFADSLGDGGPKVNVAYTYKVSGFAASFVLTGITNGGKVCSGTTGSNPCPIVTVSLGGFNSAGVAVTNLLLITNTGDIGKAMGGIAVLQ
jgi:hypothetical protein